MASLQELNSYTGNAALGAGTSGFEGPIGVPQYNLDAVDKLTQLTVQQNRDKWIQHNIEVQAQAKQAAESLAVKYGNMRAQDKEVVDGKLKELFDYYNQYPDAVRYKINADGTNNAEQHSRFTGLRKELDFYITRANEKYIQQKALDADYATITDEYQRRQYDEWKAQQEALPIDQNIVTMPKVAEFDGRKMIDEAAKAAVLTNKSVKITGDYNINTELVVVDPNNMVAELESAYYGPTTENERFRKWVDGMRDQYRALLEATDEQGRPLYQKADGSLDMEKMKKGGASVVLEMVEGYNTYLDELNKVQGQTGLRAFTAGDYIKAEDGLDEREMMKMLLVQRLKKAKAVNVDATGIASANQRAREQNASAERMAALQYADKKAAMENEELLGETKMRVWYQMLNADTNGLGQAAQFAEKDKDGRTRKVNAWEIQMAPPLVDAFTLRTGGSVQTQEGYSPYGENVTKTINKNLTPEKIYFDKDNKVFTAKYKDPEGGKAFFVRMNPEMVWQSLDGMYGEKERFKVGQASARYMKKYNVPLTLEGVGAQVGGSIGQAPAAPAGFAPAYTVPGKGAYQLDALLKKYTKAQLQQLIDKGILTPVK